MFKHNVTYIDFAGKPHNEDLYFNMLVPDFADMEFSPTFGEQTMSDYIRSEMSSGNNRKIYTVFRLLVTNSYGRRTADGERFVKKAEYTEEFLNSPAWEQFFLWLTEPETDHAQKYWEGIFPESMREQIETIESAVKADPGTRKKSIDELTPEEMRAILAKSAANN